ncbi:MAG: UDP-N-acetylmuramyl pentapeptide phosphotransferase [Acidobacteria bacterium]|nr:UDP-N-acetylmuramyl pentapeptide phosphotransferase [Acidobacteriota bacterium]MBU4307792.1 UDP-N-acetylmuramyl pentapeptide phosphotransferase [Acidobacteriota bacterium]
MAAFCVAAIWIGLPVLVWLPVAGLSLASLVGDRMELSAKLRLGLQFAAAGIACWGIAKLFPAGIFWKSSGLALWLLGASFFVVATANIFNFMDGINGIAGITGIVAFALLAGTGWMRGESHAWVLVAATLAASCAGFLPWNFPKARVFMGDVGSILLGFVFAVFVLAWSRTLSDLLMFAAFLFPFYADELVTLIPRLRDGDSLIRPHRRHIYQILVNQMGVTHWKVSLLYGIIQLGVAGGALLLYPLGWVAEMAWMGLVLGASWILASRVRRHEA